MTDAQNDAAISAAMSEGNKHGVQSTVAARIVAAYLNSASQPSAASGRELPQEEDCIVHIYPSDLARMAKDETTATVFSVAVGCPDEKSVPLYTAEQVLATLTGAAPADANAVPEAWIQYVDGEKTQNVARDPEEKAMQERIAKLMRPDARVDWIALRRCTPTAPEPSAPADKVDA